MKEARYSLTQEQLNDLAAIAADRAVEAYRSEEQKTQKRKDNENVRITKKKLQSYRRVKASLAEVSATAPASAAANRQMSASP